VSGHDDKSSQAVSTQCPRSPIGTPIGSDKTKTQTYCQIGDLSEQLIQAVQEKDRKKANALAEKTAELYKKMGPEFAALIDIEKHVDLNSRDGQEIASIVASLGESCPH
jgi:ABC-type transporter Mla subunit MlaD